MKRVTTVFKLLLTGVFVLSVSGCEKIFEYLSDHPDADIRYCNVNKLSVYYTFHPAVDATFTYNALGNPTKIEVTNVATGNPNRIFRYDAAHRMVEYVGEYLNGNYEYWHYYTYDAVGRIIQDEVYALGAIGPTGPSSYFDRRVATISYDAENRVIQTSEVSLVFGGPPVVTNYVYDAVGNLVRPGVTYDTKINIHKTNKAWMFIDRDYSLNNPFVADIYNGHRLPTKIRKGTGYPVISFLSFAINDSDVDYICD